jgi:hypothetical protein
MATFQEFHGISLAANSWIENLFVEQLVADPAPVGPGRVWFNTTDKVFRQSTLDATGGVIIRTFSTGEDLAAAVSSLSDEISTVAADLATETTARQAADAILTADLASEVSARIAADASMDARIDALGNAFNYIGALVGGADAAGATDLAALADGSKDAGDYYKVTTAGYFKVGTEQAAFFANIGDGLVFNTFGGVDKIDNTDSQVLGTADQIAVTGSADTGFVVAIDEVFSGRVSTLESGLTAEASARTAADAALQSALDAEVTARQATDAALATEVARATGVEGSLLSLTTTAKSNLVAAINELDADLASEASARIAADGVLQAAIDAETTARIAADAAAGDALAVEVTARQAADATLAADLATEVTARTAADTLLQSNIDAEATARAAADTAETSARIAADALETTARQAADATLAADLATEVTARTAGDAAINATIGSTSALTTTDKSTIVGAINEVVALVGDGVASLVTQLNNYRYVETTAVAATSHTISHGLGSTLVDVCVWIDRGDGVWRNDMAAVSIIDGTSVKVDLTAARNVRVTVERMEDFV